MCPADTLSQVYDPITSLAADGCIWMQKKKIHNELHTPAPKDQSAWWACNTCPAVKLLVLPPCTNTILLFISTPRAKTLFRILRKWYALLQDHLLDANATLSFEFVYQLINFDRSWPASMSCSTFCIQSIYVDCSAHQAFAVRMLISSLHWISQGLESFLKVRIELLHVVQERIWSVKQGNFTHLYLTDWVKCIYYFTKVS